jgi:crotonobetainyl-CoA:carnitine CoA-transferase CaiB-like acyl-CoA transferase
MDSADTDARASLWNMRDGTPVRLDEGTLEEMNDSAREMDEDLVRRIGADTHKVLRESGYAEQEIEELLEEGVAWTKDAKIES